MPTYRLHYFPEFGNSYKLALMLTLCGSHSSLSGQTSGQTSHARPDGVRPSMKWGKSRFSRKMACG